MDVLKQLHINISFVDALEQMPAYVKVLKDILAKKRQINDLEIVALTQATSDVFKKWVPAKKTYPKSFTIPYSIGEMDMGSCAMQSWGKHKFDAFLYFQEIRNRGGTTNENEALIRG